MAGAAGKKLGMTQVFDPEDGHVERVTVVEAGPCLVTAHPHRGPRRLRRRPARLRRGAREALHKARLGHLKKAGVGALRHLCEFRGEAGELEVGDELTVDGLREGPDGQGLRHLEGQGLPGHDQAPQLLAAAPSRHGSHNVRAPGSIGASADPARVFKGIRGPGQMGNKRVTQRGLEVVDVRADENLLLLRGSVPGPEGRRRRDQDGGARMAAPKAP